MKQRILSYHMAPVTQAIGHRSSLSKPVLNGALSSPTWAVACFIGWFGLALAWAPSQPTHSHFRHHPHPHPASGCHTLGSLTDYPLIPHYLPHPTQSLGPHHILTFPPTQLLPHIMRCPVLLHLRQRRRLGTFIRSPQHVTVPTAPTPTHPAAASCSRALPTDLGAPEALSIPPTHGAPTLHIFPSHLRTLFLSLALHAVAPSVSYFLPLIFYRCQNPTQFSTPNGLLFTRWYGGLFVARVIGGIPQPISRMDHPLCIKSGPVHVTNVLSFIQFLFNYSLHVWEQRCPSGPLWQLALPLWNDRPLWCMYPSLEHSPAC